MATKMKKETTKEVTITGFIEEIKLEDGKMGLQIDDGDHTYRISMDSMGRKLQSYLDEEVEIAGLVTKTANNRELKVSKYRLTDDYAYDDDSYNEEDEEDKDYYDRDYF